MSACPDATIVVSGNGDALGRRVGPYRPQGWGGWIGVVFWIAVAAAVAGSVRTLMALRK